MRLLLNAFVCIIFSTSAFGQVSPKDFNLKHGIYNVGFKQYQQVDATRTYKKVFHWTTKSIPRPIPISIWYPSTEAAETKTTILSYLEIFKAEL